MTRIQKNIQISAPINHSNSNFRRPRKYNVDGMKVGDSIFFPMDSIKRPVSSVMTCAKLFCARRNLKWSFICRTVKYRGKNGVRIWRVL